MSQSFRCTDPHSGCAIYIAESGGRIGYVYNPTAEHPEVDYNWTAAGLSKELDLRVSTDTTKCLMALAFELLRRFINFNQAGSDDEEARLP